MNTPFKWLIITAITLIPLISFTSCGRDDEDDRPSPVIPEEPIVPDDPTPTPPAHPNKILKNISETYSFSQGHEYEINVYHTNKYEVNKWSDMTVITSFTTSGDEPSEYTYNLPYSISSSWDVFNEKFVLSDHYHFVEQETISLGSESSSYYYKYDSKARLVEQTISAGSRIVYEYDDNYNIIKITEYNKNGKLSEECKITYNDIISKTIPLQCYDFTEHNFPGSYNTNLYEAGFYGISIPINLISNINVDSYLGDYQRFEYEYDYTFDSDGYVDTMTEHRYDNTMTFISTYKFTWEPVNVQTYTNWLFNDVRSPYYRLLPH